MQGVAEIDICRLDPPMRALCVKAAAVPQQITKFARKTIAVSLKAVVMDVWTARGQKELLCRARGSEVRTSAAK